MASTDHPPILMGSLPNVEEAALTTDQKISLLWRSIMGYGFGSERVPGLLEQIRNQQKITNLYIKISFVILGFFGLMMNNAEVLRSFGEIAKAVLAVGH
jgi:hypothetical protein